MSSGDFIELPLDFVPLLAKKPPKIPESADHSMRLFGVGTTVVEKER